MRTQNLLFIIFIPYSKFNYIYHVVFVNLLSGSLYFDYFQPIPPFPILMYGNHKYDFFSVFVFEVEFMFNIVSSCYTA